MTKLKKLLFVLLCTAMFLTGCSGETKDTDKTVQSEQQTAEAKRQTDKTKKTAKTKRANKAQKEDQAKKEDQDTDKPSDAEDSKAAAGDEADKDKENLEKSQTIVIDPGHSAVVAEGTEPLGPGSSEYKSADTGGTSGVSSNVPEYELTLNISRQLKQELENRGYTVFMTRETDDIPLSCVQRAEIANNADADAYVRIHANGSEDQYANGAMTICTTPQNPYISKMYSANRLLSDCILNKLCETAGCKRERVWETDTMSGNNWSKVPTTIVEIGYMSNPQEDMKMQSPEYQSQIVQGIAKGIDTYFGY